MTPDPAAMRQHLTWVVQPVRETHPHLRFEIAAGSPSPNTGRTFRIDEIDNAIGFAQWANRRSCNVYVGTTLKRASTPAKGRTRAEDAELATCLPVDIDVDLIDAVRKLATTGCRPQLVIITGTVPQPRGAAWLRLAPTTDVSIYDAACARLTALCGGDRSALGRYRLMRLAGSVSHPPPRKVARGYTTELVTLRAFDAPQHDLRELAERLPPVSNVIAFPTGQARGRAPGRARVADALARVGYGPLPLNKINAALVESMLKALPDGHADDYDTWLRVGMALHSLDWGDAGLARWIWFSQRNPAKCEATDFAAKWKSFDGYNGERITIGWLRHEAERHGWIAPCRWDRETLDVRQTKNAPPSEAARYRMLDNRTTP